MGLFSKRPDVERLQAERDLEGLAEALLSDAVREQALAALIELDDPAAVRAVAGKQKLLRATPETHAAKLELTRHYGPAALPVLKEMLLAGPNEGQAALMLATLPRELCEQPLLEAAPSERQATRSAALGVLGDLESSPAIVEAVGRGLLDEDLRVAASAGAAIGKLGDRRAMPWLMKALNLGDHNSRHHLAKDALEKLGAGREDLDEMLGDDDPTQRIAAIGALEELRDPGGADELRRLADRDPVPTIRYRAATALLECGGAKEEVADLLAPLAASSDPQVEVEAAHALAMLGDDRAVPLVKRMIESDDIERALFGALSARRLADRGALEALEHRAARDPDFARREQAVAKRLEA